MLGGRLSFSRANILSKRRGKDAEQPSARLGPILKNLGISAAGIDKIQFGSGVVGKLTTSLMGLYVVCLITVFAGAYGLDGPRRRRACRSVPRLCFHVCREHGVREQEPSRRAPGGRRILDADDSFRAGRLPPYRRCGRHATCNWGRAILSDGASARAFTGAIHRRVVLMLLQVTIRATYPERPSQKSGLSTSSPLVHRQATPLFASSG